MQIIKISLAVSLMATLAPSLVLAGEVEETYLRIETNDPSEAEPRITSIGGFGLRGSKMAHVDLSYIESPDGSDGLALDVGAGYAFRSGVSFYLGVGIVLGYDWDNEKSLTAYYPEVGVIGNLTPEIGLIISSKRYYELYDDPEDVVMVGLLFKGY
jgi:hypothetical protein